MRPQDTLRKHGKERSAQRPMRRGGTGTAPPKDGRGRGREHPKHRDRRPPAQAIQRSSTATRHQRSQHRENTSPPTGKPAECGGVNFLVTPPAHGPNPPAKRQRIEVYRAVQADPWARSGSLKGYIYQAVGERAPARKWDLRAQTQGPKAHFVQKDCAPDGLQGRGGRCPRPAVPARDRSRHPQASRWPGEAAPPCACLRPAKLRPDAVRPVFGGLRAGLAAVRVTTPARSVAPRWRLT